MRFQNRAERSKTRSLASISSQYVVAGVLALTIISGATGQSFQTLHLFAGPDGANPMGPVVLDGSGSLYGATEFGGSANAGVIYQLSPTGKLTVLYQFTGGDDGGYPNGGLVAAPSGNTVQFIGTTSGGGPYGYGTVFVVTGTGITTLHAFTGGSDGAYPMAPVSFDTHGIYGTTNAGGTAQGGRGYGTIWTLTNANHFQTLYTFGGGPDGAYPSDLYPDGSGKLWGTTQCGGEIQAPRGAGTIFSLLDNGSGFTTQSQFLGANVGTVGGFPSSSFIVTNGLFIGTNEYDGPNGGGVLFSFAPSGSVNVVHAFGGSDGLRPYGDLITDPQGNLYGTTLAGGASGLGSVYTAHTAGSGTFTTLYSFLGGIGGSTPYGGLYLHGKKHIDLYGTTSTAGALDFGTVFKIKL